MGKKGDSSLSREIITAHRTHRKALPDSGLTEALQDHFNQPAAEQQRPKPSAEMPFSAGHAEKGPKR